MRVAQVKKSLTIVYDMCAAGLRVAVDFDSNKRDLSHAENKLAGEGTYFKWRNRVWELEVNIIPKAETKDILTKMQEQNVEQLGREGGVMTEATAHHDVPDDHDPACEPSAIRGRVETTAV